MTKKSFVAEVTFTKIFTLFLGVIMKESLFFVDKKLLKGLFGNLIFD